MKKSAGILLYRKAGETLEVFLVHPGGPYWKNKDSASWTIPKGELDENEDILAAAKRELKEETGIAMDGPLIELHPITQKNGKVVFAWALEGHDEIKYIESNTFEMEWPPKSGKMQMFPEIDRGEWFSLADAENKIVQSQWPLVLELIQKLHDK